VGRDGRIQGLLDTIGVPYTGSGVLASALAMDKEVAKLVLAAAGLDVPRGVVVRARARPISTPRDRRVAAFVKPVGSGSSVGASIVRLKASSPRRSRPRWPTTSAFSSRSRSGPGAHRPVIGNDDLAALPVIEILTKARVLRLQREVRRW